MEYVSREPKRFSNEEEIPVAKSFTESMPRDLYKNEIKYSDALFRAVAAAFVVGEYTYYWTYTQKIQILGGCAKSIGMCQGETYDVKGLSCKKIWDLMLKTYPDVHWPDNQIRILV